jgi:hypothetical protein
MNSFRPSYSGRTANYIDPYNSREYSSIAGVCDGDRLKMANDAAKFDFHRELLPIMNPPPLNCLTVDAATFFDQIGSSGASGNSRQSTAQDSFINIINYIT